MPDAVLTTRDQTSIYKIYVEGFSNSFETLSALKAWVDGLKTSFPWIVGKQAKIWVGKGTSQVATYASAPSRILTVEAL